MVNDILKELNKDWFNRFTFTSQVEHLNGLEFTQTYHVDYEKRPDPESKFIVHGTDTYMLSINHLCAFFIYLIWSDHDGLFTRLQDQPFCELSKRILFAKSELQFSRPVFVKDVKVKSQVTSFKDRFEKHQMIFLDADVDIADGCHQFKMNGVINMRDELIYRDFLRSAVARACPTL